MTKKHYEVWKFGRMAGAYSTRSLAVGATGHYGAPCQVYEVDHEGVKILVNTTIPNIKL